jgi:catechol 2,3-dioxygenase-like lactoylglutathione lyase family enzyme
MTLFMTELSVADLAASVRWYVALGFMVQLHDDAHGFVLLHDGHSGRLALKTGTPKESSMILHIEVTELPPGEVKRSTEGYDRVILPDPDGYRVCCFRRWAAVDPPPLCP